MKISGNAKAGLVAVTSLLLFVWLVNFLKGWNILKRGRSFYAVYSDVSGLQPGSPVLINGLSVGSVQRIEFDKKRDGKLVLAFRVDTDLKFSRHTVVKVVSSGFIGGKVIALHLHHDGPLAQSGDTLPSEVEVGIGSMLLDQVGPFKDKLEELVTLMDSTLLNLRELTDLENRNRIKAILATLERTLNNYDQLAVHLNEQLSPRGALKQTLDGASRSFNHIATLTDRLSKVPLDTALQRLNYAAGSLDSILEKVDDKRGSLGWLVNDAKLYHELQQTTRQLQLLLRDLRLHPKRYVHFSIFGAKEKPCVPLIERTDSTR